MARAAQAAPAPEDDPKDQKGAKPKQEPLARYERASVSLLSQEPSEADTSDKPDPKWPAFCNILTARINSLYQWRNSWWIQNWSDLAQYILPRRSIWLTQSAGGLPTPNNMTRGREINQAIVDPTATYAARVCASGLMSGLASPSRPWFKIAPSMNGVEIDTAGREWLDEVESRIYTVLAASNFYNSFAQECEDLVVFGTAPVVIYEDEKEIIRCYNPCVGEYFLSSGASLRADGFARLFLMTTEQVVDFFGVELTPQEIKAAWKNKGAQTDKEVIIAHIIEPNYALGKDKLGVVKGNFAWREVYWLWGNAGARPLSIRGFNDQPFTAGRWSTQSNDAYGRSPGMDVLPDVLQLQVMTRRMAEAIEKQVRPPLMASMSLKNQPSSSIPGSVTFVESLGPQTGMRPIYEVNPDIGAMAQNILAIEQRIQKGFFNDVLLMMQNLPKVARTTVEIAALNSERLSVLGPVVENLLSESLRPKLRRIVNIMKKRGLLSDPPDSLKDAPLSFDFVSILAIAAKGTATGGLERIAGFVGNLVAVYPEAKDVLDPEITIREFNELLGNPQKILRSPQQMSDIKQQQAKAMQAQQAQANMAQGVQTASVGADAAQTLAGTEVGPGRSALQALLGSQ